MTAKTSIGLRVSPATLAKLRELAELHGTQTEVVAVAIDRLHQQTIHPELTCLHCIQDVDTCEYFDPARLTCGFDDK